MTMWELLDEKSYFHRRDEIDAAILGALADGGKTHAELIEVLRQKEIGNARSDNPLELSYSTTGSIMRSAINSLRCRGLIYDSWDSAIDRNYVKPFRFFRFAEPSA